MENYGEHTAENTEKAVRNTERDLRRWSMKKTGGKWIAIRPGGVTITGTELTAVCNSVERYVT
jgi:hypothetical protein